MEDGRCWFWSGKSATPVFYGEAYKCYLQFYSKCEMCIRDRQKGEEVEEHLDYEVKGIHDILKNCSEFSIHMGGVYIEDVYKRQG